MKRNAIQTCRIVACRIVLALAAVAVVAGGAVTRGHAQSKQSPGLFKANPQKRDQPVRITSASLEVRDKDKKATFAGDVHVVQGDIDVRCSRLIVYYDAEAAKGPAKPAPKGTAGSNQQIRRMEAIGSVIMTQNEQRAVGDRADFDVPRNIMVLTGNVVVTRGEDVLRGQRLHVDMTTGIYRMESGGGRVEGVFNSKSQPQLPRPGRPN